jgi:integrase
MLVAARSIFGADTRVEEIATPASVEHFVTVRRSQVGEASFRHNCWALKQALMWSQGQGWIAEVPEIVVPKMPPPRQVWLRSHEIAPFLERCSDAFRPVAEAAIFFGLRVGEACIAQAGDFDLSAGVLYVVEKPDLGWKPKGRRARGIPLVGRGREIAERIAQQESSDWAWPNRKGGRRSPGTWFSRATRRAAEAAGIRRDLVYHDLRRTFGAMMIEGGAHIRAVQRALGHVSVVTTEKVYARVTHEFGAEGIQKMDEMLAAKQEAYTPSQPALPSRLRVVR